MIVEKIFKCNIRKSKTSLDEIIVTLANEIKNGYHISHIEHLPIALSVHTTANEPDLIITLVAALPSGEPVEEDDVNFWDYDGTLIVAYSAADFANLDELPPNPSHFGLIAQGWNWSLSDAKTYVATYGKLNIGQMYVTDNGKTRKKKGDLSEN